MRKSSSNVVLYLAAVYPHARGVKWVRSLLDAGFSPVVAYGRGRDALWNSDDGLRLLTEPALGRKAHLIPAQASKRIFDRLRNAGQTPAIVLVRDVFLTPVAKHLAERFDCPWVLDLCDNYPEVTRQLSSAKRPWRRAAAYFIQHIESRAVSTASATVFVSPESRSMVLEKVCRGRPHDRPAFSIENAPWNNEKADIRPTRTKGTNLVYIGTVDSNIRDFGTVLKGLKLHQERTGNHVWVDLFTIDRAKAERELGHAADNWGRFVRILDAVPAAELSERMSGYLAGLVPHHAGPAVDYTISNKIFDYLYAGVPVLASDNPPNVRLLETVGGGVTYVRESPSSFAEVLGDLVNGSGRLRPSDIEVISGEFTWQSQVADFIEYLKTLPGRRAESADVANRFAE